MQNFSDTGRGMGARKDIYRGESILSIQNVITARFIIKSNPELVLMMESQDYKVKQIDVFELLLLWLLLEDSKGKESARDSIIINRIVMLQPGIHSPGLLRSTKISNFPTILNSSVRKFLLIVIRKVFEHKTTI